MDKPLSDDHLKRNRQARLLKSGLILLGCTALFAFIVDSLETSIDRRDIRTARVIRQDIQTGFSAGGTIVPRFEETIPSQLDSQLSKILVSAGERVKKGQLMMRLDTSADQLKLDNMQEEIALKENKIRSRELELVRSTNDIRGKLELLQVDLDSRQTRLKRMQQLSHSGGTSKHDLKEAELNVKRTQIEIRQLKQSMEDTKASTVAEMEGLTLEKSILKKSLSEKRRLVQSAAVKAPRDGLITWLKNQEGSAVKNGDPLVRIADTKSYKMEATVSDFYSNQLWQGMTARFQYDNHRYSGSVSSIIASDQQGVLILTIELNRESSDAYKKLRLKQRVDVFLVTDTISNSLVVAKGPFISSAGVQQIFVINDNQAERIQVTVGSGNSEYYQIKQGLKEGDEIIISDVSAFAQRSRVEIN